MFVHSQIVYIKNLIVFVTLLFFCKGILFVREIVRHSIKFMNDLKCFYNFKMSVCLLEFVRMPVHLSVYPGLQSC